MKPYDERFYNKLREGARRSAKAVAAVVNDLVEPRSVVDVGCGSASFAAAFRELGARVKGCDGAYALESGLDIPAEDFTAIDLSDADDCRRRIAGTFDLAICLEVAEHLPEEASDGLVDFLTSLSEIVLFSAAVPRQKGTNHINLQWPDYWDQKFRRRDHACMDLLRPILSYDTSIEPWYRQNMMLFIAEPRYDSMLQKALRLGLIARALRTPAAIRHPHFK